MAALCWSSHEDIPNAQGKTNPSKMVGVAREHQRANTLKPYSQNTSQSNHTRTTALSNSMKLSHARGATQDGRVMVERFHRIWSTGEGNGKPLQYSCLENPMNSMNSMCLLRRHEINRLWTRFFVVVVVFVFKWKRKKPLKISFFSLQSPFLHILSNKLPFTFHIHVAHRG